MPSLLKVAEDLLSEHELIVEAEPLNPIEEFLNGRGITIRSIPPEDPADSVINSLSLYLGEHYDELQRILGKIKRHMQKGSFFNENIKDNPQQTISVITQFCTNLHNIAFSGAVSILEVTKLSDKSQNNHAASRAKFFSLVNDWKGLYYKKWKVP